MSLKNIEDEIEKLSKNNSKTFSQIVLELKIDESILTSWVESFSDLEPKITKDDEKIFSNRQLNIIKKIKNFVIDEEGDINDLMQVFNKKIVNQKTSNTTKKHYFDQDYKDLDDEAFSSNLSKDSKAVPDDLNQYENDDQQLSINFNYKPSLQNSQKNLEPQFKNIIDPNAKIKDFSNIKLYNIHPSLREQIDHRLKCVKLNLGELNNLLKNL